MSDCADCPNRCADCDLDDLIACCCSDDPQTSRPGAGVNPEKPRRLTHVRDGNR